MKNVAIYWIIGCLLNGAGVGLHAKRCPNERVPLASEIIFDVAIWPVGFGFVLFNRTLPECKI